MALSGIDVKEMADKGVAAFRNEMEQHGMSGANTKVMRQLLRTRDGLVRYLAKAIPCSCLNDLKKQGNAGPKMGICAFCDKKDTKVNLFKCSRCIIAKYCSKECQKADWKLHKALCNHIGKQKS
jgi:hypothetical protein